MRVRSAAMLALLATLLIQCSDDSTASSSDADTSAASDTAADTPPTDDTSDTSGDGALDVAIVDGEAVVSWNAPATRADGSDLAADAIGGYRVHFGTAPRRYDQVIDVGRVGSVRIGDLAEGARYYFAVTAYDLSDRESDFSEEVFKDL